MAHLVATYNRLMTFADPRVKDWPLMETPWPTLSIIAVYIAGCLAAPRIFKGRKFAVRPLVLAYNLFSVALNAYMGYELIVNSTLRHWECMPIPAGKWDESAQRIAAALWLFYISKAIEMLDSVFFILKGNYNQLSFLHIYHHSTMLFFWWLGSRFVPGGSSVVGPTTNCIIHIAMYGYYFVAALGPQFKKYIKWKKYLTMLQICQFFTNIYFCLKYIKDEECSYPKALFHIMVIYQISFIALFGNFFFINYIRKRQLMNFFAEKKNVE
jgi:elongation of very long chain fatty acids protein 4